MARGYRKAVYQIGITADTTEFQQALMNVIQSLNQLGHNTQLTQNLQQASAAALDLSKHLSNAINQNTGKLDLRELDESLKRSNITLREYAQQLSQLGPAGRTAFLDVAKVITQTELPLRRSNRLLNELWITMKNTMRWQLTSNMLHGFIGALETAYGYSKSLDASLNSIRIVTQQSTEDMAKFAVQANNAAKALNTTTVDYTDASLIYYQQGLNNEEVQERTNTTIKMANVANETAEIVSQQLTAIWNNFYNGSKSLEYYADVMVALGANTASSSDEIAEGIQKFASIASTVGLSYEYAASALATLTANTRESANVVGNSLKTLFSRIQGLQLGETLEDGTDFNKYSDALNAVGVSIKDINGDLKDMDTILDETAGRWNVLTRAQQMALAQTVAGVRQYTQFIALMENWEDFQENLNVALGSEGALQEQAEIYAESWEAARKNIKAAAEDIYDSLINPDFYIDMNKMISPILSGIAKMIDGMGGFQGVLSGVFVLINKIYGDRISQSMVEMASTLGITVNQERAHAQALKDSAASMLQLFNNQRTYWGEVERYQLDSIRQYAELEQKATEYSASLNTRQQAELQADINRISKLQEMANYYANLSNAQRESANNYSEMVLINLRETEDWRQVLDGVIDTFNNSFSHFKAPRLNIDASSVDNVNEAVGSLLAKLEEVVRERQKLRALRQELLSIGQSGRESSEYIRELAISLNLISATDTDSKIQGVFNTIRNGEGIVEETDNKVRYLQESLQNLGANPNRLRSFIQYTLQSEDAMTSLDLVTRNEVESINKLNTAMANNTYATQNWAEALVNAGSILSKTSMLLNSLNSLFDLFNGEAEDLSGSETLVRFFSSLGFLIPSAISLFNNYKTALAALKTVSAGTTIASTAAAGAISGAGTAATGAAGAVAGFGSALAGVVSTVAPLISILAVVGFAISKYVDSINKKKEAEIQARQEASDAIAEEISNNESLIDSYNNLLSKYKETGEGKGELAQKALEIADALDLEGVSVANLTGDYTSLNEQIAEYRENANSRALEANRAIKDDKGEALVSSMRGSVFDKRKFKDSGYILGIGTGSINFESIVDWGGAQQQALKETDFYKNYYNNTANQSQFDKYTNPNQGFFRVESQSTEALVEFRKQAEEAISMMQKVQEETGEAPSYLYNYLTKFLEDTQEAWDNYAEISEQISSQSFQEALDSINIDITNIDSYNEYLKYYKALNEEVQKRVESGDIEADKVDKLTLSYLSGEEALRRYVTQQQLITNLKSKFNLSNKDLDISALEKMEDSDLELVFSIIPEANSLEEFKVLVEHALTESAGNAAMKSINIMGDLVQELNKNMHISDKNYETLQTDTSFMEEIEAEFGSYENFLRESETQQIEYVRDYYTAISQFAAQNLSEQQEYIEKEKLLTIQKYNALNEVANNNEEILRELADLRTEYNTVKSEEEKNAIIDKWNEVQDKISDIAGYEVNLDINKAEDSLDELGRHLDELNDKLENLKNFKIDIAINWDDFDDIKGQIDSLQKFASVMQDENKLVADSYQYPIDAIRSWMDVYPELFAQAQTTDQGLIQIDQEVVDNYIQGQKDQTNENIEQKIKQWELEKEDLLLTKQQIQAEAEAYAALGTEELRLETLTNEQIANMVQQLTDYQIASGVKEEEAHTNALEAMGLNEEQYSKIVSEVAEANAKNMTDSANIGAENTTTALQRISEGIKAVGHNIKEAFKAFIDPTYTPDYHSVFTSGGNTVNFTGYTVDTDFTTYDPEEVDPIEAFKTQKIKALEVDLSHIDDAIANIDAKILGAQALLNAPAKEGSGGPEKDTSKKSGSKDNTGKILDPEQKKDLKEIEERYHEITREIKRQADLLDDINNAVERAYGVNKIKSYKKEQEALNKQLDNQRKKLAEAEKYLEGDKNAVLSVFSNAIFNDKGEIENYTALLHENFNTYNDFIDKYNEYRATYSTWTKDQQEAAEAELNNWELLKQAADTAYERNLEVLKQYEETLDITQETRDNIEQLQRDIDDNRLSQIEYRLEIVLEVKNMKDLVSSLTKKIAESFGDAITHGLKVAEISASDAQREAALYPEYKQQYDNLVKEYENADTQADRDRIIKDIEELQSKVVASGEALLEWIETLDDLLPNAINDARERFEHFTNWLDHNTTVLDTIKELYALQGVTYKTQQGYERLQKTSAEKMEALTNKAALNRSWYENASKQVEIARAKLESLNGNEQDVRWDIYKANYDALLAEQQKAQEAMLSSAKEAMETAREMATLSLEKTVYDLKQQLSKGLGLDLLQDKYDHYIETEERYLDKVNEAYQVASWYDKLQKDIDKTTDKAMKDRLKALQEEINTRREGNKLSQYDLNILEAKYKVLQAQMALEDARNTKNKVNLVRDRQGNWNYQFSADPDEVANAQQNLIDAENEWYNIAKQQVKDVTGEIISTMQECSDKVKEIWQQMIEGTLTEEEGYARIAELRKYYTEKIKYLEEEKNIAIADMNEAGNKALLDMAILYGDKVSDLTGLTAEEVKNIIKESGMSIKDLLLADNETIKNIIGSNTSLIDLFNNVFAKDLADMTSSAVNFEKYLDEALNKCQNNWQKYGDKVQDIADKTGTSLDKLKDQVDDVSESNESMYTMGMQAVDALWEQLDATRAAAEGYAELAQQIMDVIQKLQELAAAQAEYVEKKADLDNSEWKYTVSDYSREMLKVFNEQGADALFGDKYKWLWTERESKYQAEGWANKGAKSNDELEKLFRAAAAGDPQALKELERVGRGGYFDTGGYTGEFNDAKLAFLHEKELVLNQNDTKNMLAAVAAVREIGPGLFSSIEKIIDGNANAAMSLLATRLNDFGQTEIPNTTIEQKVSIEHVEFPNVTSHDEIIQAFEGLTNDAAQWAQRRTS